MPIPELASRSKFIVISPLTRWIELSLEGIAYIDASDVDDTVKVLLKVSQ